MRTLDVGVIIHLDPLRHFLKAKCLCQALQKLTLRLRLRHFPRKAFACVAHRTVHDLSLLTPLRHNQLNFSAKLLRQSVRHQVLIQKTMTEQDLTWRIFGVVELTHERFQDFGLVDISRQTRIIILVAPILIGANEENLHTGLPPLHVQPDHIRLGHPTWIDPLRSLHLCQRFDAITQRSCALKFHLFRCLRHLAR